ncbi:MAG: hypothetical protein IIA72_11400 [Proteobacteria bacterium]|nr:hypothetical protein [Pseudomonadota bacterium]
MNWPFAASISTALNGSAGTPFRVEKFSAAEAEPTAPTNAIAAATAIALARIIILPLYSSLNF